MSRRVLVAAALALAIPAVPAAQETSAKLVDLTGKWNGSFIMTVDGQQNDDVAFMTLTQKGDVITGTAGPSLDEQWPIANGKIDGGKITFDVHAQGPLIHFTLALVDGRLKGEAQGEMEGRKLSAVVDLGRSKD
jgi:hypothetical protein